MSCLSENSLRSPSSVETNTVHVHFAEGRALTSTDGLGSNPAVVNPAATAGRPKVGLPHRGIYSGLTYQPIIRPAAHSRPYGKAFEGL